MLTPYSIAKIVCVCVCVMSRVGCTQDLEWVGAWGPGYGHSSFVLVFVCVCVISLYLSTTPVCDKLSDPFSLLVGLHRGCPGEGVEGGEPCFALQTHIQGEADLLCRYL